MTEERYPEHFGTLRPRRFLAAHAVVNPLGAPLRTLLERTLARQQEDDQIQASAQALRLHRFQQRVQEDISAAQTSLRLLQSQHERLATGANFPQLQDYSYAFSASQLYQLMPNVPPAARTRSSMLNSNPVTVPSCPNVSSYATAQPAVRAANQWGSYKKPLDSIPVDAICRVFSKKRAASVENNAASKVASSQPLPKKRRREVSNTLDDGSKNESRLRTCQEEQWRKLLDGSKNEGRFRVYQERQWRKFFDELRRYRDRTGNCSVPRSYTPLGKWVKRQRYKYKLMIDGKPSAMSEERAKELEEIGFVWCPQESTWLERFGELKEFRRIFHHCNVPTDYDENPPLANWVKNQRRQYKLYREDKSSNMKVQRIRDLEDIGFEWTAKVKRIARS
jgi:hypothetical protein